MDCQSHNRRPTRSVDKQGVTARWVRSKHQDDVTEHQNRVVYTSLCTVRPDHHGAWARPHGLRVRIITDLGPTRIGVNPTLGTTPREQPWRRNV